MTSRLLYSLVVAALMMTACADDVPVASTALQSDAKGLARVAAPVPAVAPDPADAPLPKLSDSATVRPSSMVIRTGVAEIEVPVLDSAIAQLTALAARVGGFVGNSSIQSGEGQRRRAELQLKIPAARYGDALSGLPGIGKLISSNTNAEDVGEEYVDVSARMANSRRLEERLVNLLANRTGKLEDVLAVERELARVREEIDRFEGRLRFLRSQVAISTLTVSVYEPGPIVGDPGSSPLGNAFKNAWRNFMAVVTGGIAMLGVLVPLGLMVALILWAATRWRDRHPLKPPAAKVEPPQA